MYDQPLNTLTASELIEILSDLPPETPVVFAAEYGDYGRTIQALPIEGSILAGVRLLRERGYSRSGWAVPKSYDEGFEGDDEDEDEEGDDDAPVVAVIR